MNNRNNIKLRSFKKRLSADLLKEVALKSIGFVAAVIVLYLIAATLCSMRTWYEYELIYKILSTIRILLPFAVFIALIIGICAIFFRAWLKTLGYLENVLDATESIYLEDNALIELPPELNEVENQLNRIKLTVNENKRLAKESEKRKNDLVVYLAHDLKTPLTSVIGYLTLLRDENRISEELRQKYLAISLDKAERLEDLINEFFEITRFNLSDIIIEPSTVNLTRMLEQLLYEFKPMLAEKELECRLDAQPDIIVKCDANKMQRVFDNLLRNAVNYSFEKSDIEITASIKDSNVNLRFVNKGDTIPPEKLARVFEQFYRLDSARTSKSGGAGLGLAISKQIVELHGGKINANSENDIICFEVTLPLSLKND